MASHMRILAYAEVAGASSLHRALSMRPRVHSKWEKSAMAMRAEIDMSEYPKVSQISL